MKQFIAQALIVHRSNDPTVNDNLSRGFDVESEWYNGVKFWKLLSFSGSYANWSLVGSASTPFTETITGDGNTANDTRIIVHNKNNSTPSVQLWYEYETGKWRQLDVTQGITTETATPNQLLLNLLAYEGNQTSNKYSIIVQ